MRCAACSVQGVWCVTLGHSEASIGIRIITKILFYDNSGTTTASLRFMLFLLSLFIKGVRMETNFRGIVVSQKVLRHQDSRITMHPRMGHPRERTRTRSEVGLYLTRLEYMTNPLIRYGRRPH